MSLTQRTKKDKYLPSAVWIRHLNFNFEATAQVKKGSADLSQFDEPSLAVLAAALSVVNSLPAK